MATSGSGLGFFILILVLALGSAHQYNDGIVMVCQCARPRSLGSPVVLLHGGTNPIQISFAESFLITSPERGILVYICF